MFVTTVLTPDTVDNFDVMPFVGDNGCLNEAGLKLMAKVADKLPPFHKGKWGPAFVPVMSKIVPVALELVIVKDRQVLLAWREDDGFHGTGWHAPGTYVGPGEDWQDTVQRCADREIKASVEFEREIGIFNMVDSPRFHGISVLVLCRIHGEPQAGQWFERCPKDMLDVHKRFVLVINGLLGWYSY